MDDPLTADGAPAPAAAFGLDAFTRDDRMRLFSFTNAEKSVAYLWTLRAFDRARANYVVLLHTSDVASVLLDLATEYEGRADVPRLTVEDLTPLLDQLYGWQLLDRSYDGARAATLAEYRNRHYVYQFTQAGYRAYRAVEDVLGARMDDATLSRLVLPELLEDLDALARANLDGDAEQVSVRPLGRPPRCARVQPVGTGTGGAAHCPRPRGDGGAFDPVAAGRPGDTLSPLGRWVVPQATLDTGTPLVSRPRVRW